MTVYFSTETAKRSVKFERDNVNFQYVMYFDVPGQKQTNASYTLHARTIEENSIGQVCLVAQIDFLRVQYEAQHNKFT